jgi:hypothetical protein
MYSVKNGDAMPTANCMLAKNSENGTRSVERIARHRSMCHGDSSEATCPGGS